MDLIEQLVSCSESLLKVLQYSADERDKQVEKVVQLLAEREKIIAQLKEKSRENLSQHPKARKIVEMEQDIQKGLRRLYEDIKIDLKKWNEKKRLRQCYTNTFAHVATYDGRFYDKRR
jgi:flagellar protein FliT